MILEFSFAILTSFSSTTFSSGTEIYARMLSYVRVDIEVAAASIQELDSDSARHY